MRMICHDCGKIYTTDDLVWRCDCGGYLTTELSEPCQEHDIVQNRYSLWRYERSLPFKLTDSTVSFQEGLTPLVKDSWNGFPLFLKLDYMMPTGSFKDRGVVMMVNYLRSNGVRHVVEDSSGNAGSSLAAYCAKANIKCHILVPANASEAKISQIALYGAELYKIPGTRQDVALAVQKNSCKAFYASHNWHPLFIEGTKTLAYEVWEQLGFRFPDNIFVPVGGGSSLLGFYKGFRELASSLSSESLPRIFAFQAQNCAPLTDISLQITPIHTIAEGIAIADPLRKEEIVEAVKTTRGFIHAVTEDEILAALKKAALKGYFIEPTSAVALAGFEKFLGSGVIARDDINVVLLTGSGLKAANEITLIMKNMDQTV
jgi:threonine synthase